MAEVRNRAIGMTVMRSAGSIVERDDGPARAAAGLIGRRAKAHRYHRRDDGRQFMETVRWRPRPAPDRSSAPAPSNGTAIGPRQPTVSVVVPALNEARNLPHVLGRIPPVHEVILVDGGSLDDTVAVAQSLLPDIRVIQQNRQGKGNALACGFAAATGEIIVMIDADASTDPAEIPQFIAALRAGADFAKGSRFIAAGGSADITPTRRLGNKGLNLLVNVLFGTRYSDLCYGYNAFWAHCLPVFALDTVTPRPVRDGRLWGDGFEIETLLNLRATRSGLKVAEVASFEHTRLHGTSNLNAAKDGMRVLRTIATEWRRREPPASPPADRPGSGPAAPPSRDATPTALARSGRRLS